MFEAFAIPSDCLNYRLLIDIELYSYMMTLAQESLPNEILGMGAVAVKSSKYCTDFILEDIFIPEQLVSPSYCTFKEGAQNRIIEEVIERGGDVEKLCFRWHSHANGPVYFSPVDEKDIKNCDSPYVVNLVVNARQEMKARLDILEPARAYGRKIRFSNVPVSVVVQPLADETAIKECQDDIASCCEELANVASDNPYMHEPLDELEDILNLNWGGN